MAEENKDEEKKKGCQLDVCQPGYPKHVFFIIGNEFCERFCYYGMRAILQTYLMLALNQTPDMAGILYHAFAIVSYFMPLPGAIIADSFLGKYWTIFSLSLVYVAGNVIMATTTLNGGIFEGALIGMFTIAIGTGGIKPCVSSFGADQFSKDQLGMQKSFFSMFYISINAGSLLAQIVTPIIKATPCFGEDSCWVLAFGLPAALMVVAVIFFVIGTPFYTRRPVEENVIVMMCGAVGKAIGRSCGKDKKKVDHWLDRAVPDYTQQFCNDCKAVFRVLVLFIPLPFFWALFDQSGSRWTYQVQKMSTYIDFLDIHLEPEQVQIANGLLIICLVPVFDGIVYPICAKCGLFVRPLQRIVGGCALAALSFFVIGAVQIGVQNGNDVMERGNPETFRTRVFNVNPDCSVEIQRQSDIRTLVSYNTTLYTAGEADNGTIFTFISTCTGSTVGITQSHTLLTDDSRPLSSIYFDEDQKIRTVYGASFPVDDNGKLQQEYLFQIMVSSYTYLPPTEIIKIAPVRGGEFAVFEPNGTDPVPPTRDFVTWKVPSYNYEFRYWKADGTSEKLGGKFSLLQGGAYTFYMKKNDVGEYEVELLEEKGINLMHSLYQVIPYFVITCGEILFSITGLSFAFSQAPPSMKSILTAGWLLTASFGNVIDMIMISFQIPDKALEFFVFAILMVAVTIIFAIMTCFYTYVEDLEEETEPGQDGEKPRAQSGAIPMHPLPSNPYLLEDPQNTSKVPPPVENPVARVVVIHPQATPPGYLGSTAPLPNGGHFNQGYNSADQYDEVVESF